MAVMARRPTPGQAKMVSVTTAPPRRKPYCSPTTVTTGMSAFFSACLPTIPSGETPLARARSEDGPGDDGPAEEKAVLQPHHRHHRDERVLQRVLADHPERRDALGTRQIGRWSR